MTFQKHFENRSGRVIAVFRAMLAFVFLIVLVIEPASSPWHVDDSLQLLGGYFLASLGLILLAWRSWWYDQLLAPWTLAMDALVFIAAVFLTESWDADFTSPFLAFFALVALSATLRWNWRVAGLTGLVVTVLFLATGLGMMAADMTFDSYRFVRRALYMLALLLVLVWFGVQRREPQVPAVRLPAEGDGDEAVMWRAVDYARELTGAAYGLVAWAPGEEPWAEVCVAGPQGRHSLRAGPEQLAGWDEGRDRAELFDIARSRSIALVDGDVRPKTGALRSRVPLADMVGISEGLRLPFRAASGEGMILLGGIMGPGPDQLSLGRALAREVGSAFDRMAVRQLEQRALVERTRSAIARDLHDSVAQSLAGACFRLEALRRELARQLGAAAEGPCAEVASVRDALRREQGHVRGLIDALRAPPPKPRSRDLRGDLDQALADAGGHWGLGVALDAPDPVNVPDWLSHEVQQLVREAVANAARHGEAGRVRVRLDLAGGRLALHIHDDGAGFDASAQQGRPWSISERVAAMGGEFSVSSQPGDTRLAIILSAEYEG